MDMINIVTNESTNINKYCISNTLIHLQYGILHYISEDVEVIRMSAIGCTTMLQKHLLATIPDKKYWDRGYFTA